jgi:hypothetical protein
MRSVFLVLLAVALVPANAGAAQPSAEKSTAKRISNHIQQSGQLRNYRIGVTFKNGVATIAGTVTSQEQLDSAIRLAKEVDGVKRVECKLQCTADQAELTEANGAGRETNNEFAQPNANGNAIAAGYQGGDQSGVMQAFGERAQFEAAPQQQRTQMMARNNAPLARQQSMQRNNMPLPSPRPGMGMDPAIQQASAQQGCYQAGGPCPQGYGGMGPMGPQTGGPGMGGQSVMGPQGMPAGVVPTSYGHGPAYENPSMPGYAWPSYAAYPNYAALSYPQQYSPTAWPYIGPFYPYPQVPLAWRKVSLEWDDGWWFLDFSAHNSSH